MNPQDHNGDNPVPCMNGNEHEYMHAHGIPHAHGHSHPHEHTKAVLNRLSRAIGHLQHVRSMVEDGRDCSEVLIHHRC